MCTLILGRDVLGADTVVIAANRDEAPDRPSEPPRVLHESPRVVGGRDARAGGTWLAVRAPLAATGAGAEPRETRPLAAAGGVAALLNRRARAGAPPARRSRGLLALEVAAAASPRAAAQAAAHSGDYAPCTLVWASPGSCWLLALPEDGPPRFEAIARGWHVITHTELDDRDEPRCAWLHRELLHFQPGSVEMAFAGLAGWLAHHATPSTPAVCLHEGPMPTRSSARLFLAHGALRYEHAEGRPCTARFDDVGALLAAPAVPERTP